MEREKREKEEKKKKNAKVLERVNALLGPNENGKSSAERVKRFHKILKEKTATEREQILEETSDILEQVRDLEETNDEDLVPPEYWKKVKLLEESAKKRHKKTDERGTRSHNNDTHFERVQTIKWWADKGKNEWESAARRTTTAVSFSTTERQVYKIDDQAATVN